MDLHDGLVAICRHGFPVSPAIFCYKCCDEGGFHPFRFTRWLLDRIFLLNNDNINKDCYFFNSLFEEEHIGYPPGDFNPFEEYRLDDIQSVLFEKLVFHYNRCYDIYGDPTWSFCVC